MGNPIMSLQGTSQFPITPSDTVVIALDAGNTKLAPYCYVHNNTATGGQVRVMAIDDTVATLIYLNAGATHPVPVKQVFATSPAPPATLLGIISNVKV